MYAQMYKQIEMCYSFNQHKAFFIHVVNVLIHNAIFFEFLLNNLEITFETSSVFSVVPREIESIEIRAIELVVMPFNKSAAPVFSMEVYQPF